MNKLLISLSAIAIAAASAYANAQTPSAGASLQTNGTAAVAPEQVNTGAGLKADVKSDGGAKLDTESAKSQLNTKAEHGAKAAHEHKAKTQAGVDKTADKVGKSVSKTEKSAEKSGKAAKADTAAGLSADAGANATATTQTK